MSKSDSWTKEEIYALIESPVFDYEEYLLNDQTNKSTISTSES